MFTLRSEENDSSVALSTLILGSLEEAVYRKSAVEEAVTDSEARNRRSGLATDGFEVGLTEES